MDTFLHKQFKLNLRSLTEKDNILIAVSGGQDSICLAKLIYDCFIKYKSFKIEAIYIDHQWKADSILHTRHVINYMHNNSIPISIYQIQRQAFSENEARNLRYKILTQHAVIYGYTKIVTGHNQNDKIETALQNIIRGTSLNGLTNLTSSKKINNNIAIIRPLINFTRSEIAWFCRHFCLPIWSDITNYNYKVKRNRIRYELMPYLQNHFNPSINQTIYNFLRLCWQDNEYIKENSLKLYKRSKHKYLIGLNFKLLSKQHKVLQKRVVQLYIYYNFNKVINQNRTEEIISQISSSNINKKTIKFHNLITYFINGWLYTYFNSR